MNDLNDLLDRAAGPATPPLDARADLSREQKLAARDEAFRRAKERFATEITPRLKVQTFATFTGTPLNNATLIARRLYYHRLELFDRVLRSRGGDLRRTVDDLVWSMEHEAVHIAFNITTGVEAGEDRANPYVRACRSMTRSAEPGSR